MNEVLEISLSCYIALNVIFFLFYLMIYLMEDREFTKEDIHVWHILILPGLFLAWLLSRRLYK